MNKQVAQVGDIIKITVPGSLFGMEFMVLECPDTQKFGRWHEWAWRVLDGAFFSKEPTQPDDSEPIIAYLVYEWRFADDRDSYVVHGIFSTRRLAEEYIDDNCPNAEVKEYIMDSCLHYSIERLLVCSPRGSQQGDF